MSEAPEKIWAYRFENGETIWHESEIKGGGNTEYRRADLPPTLSAAMELPEVREMHAELIYLREMHNLGIAGALWSSNHSKDVWRTKADDALAHFTEAKP